MVAALEGSFEERVARHFGFLVEEHGFRLERVSSNPGEEDGYAEWVARCCRLRLVQHHGDGVLEWRRDGTGEEWLGALWLHRYLFEGVARQVDAGEADSDWMGAMATEVQQAVNAVLAFFATQGWHERRAAYARATEARREAFRRERGRRR